MAASWNLGEAEGLGVSSPGIGKLSMLRFSSETVTNNATETQNNMQQECLSLPSFQTGISGSLRSLPYVPKLRTTWKQAQTKTKLIVNVSA